MLGQPIDNHSLSLWAENAARELKPQGSCTLRRTARQVHAAFRDIKEYANHGEGDEGVLRWLRDNLYLLRTAAEDAETAMSRRGKLRRCQGRARISVAAKTLLESGAYPDMERCRIFLEGFQNRLVLTEKELELFPTVLTAELLFALWRLCGNGKAREAEVAALMGSLRLCVKGNWGRMLESVNRCERVLSRDPAGVYPRMDAESRRDYRRRLDKLAQRRGIEAHILAERLLRECAESPEHIGFALYRGDSVPDGRLYIAANVLLTGFLSLLFGFCFERPAASLLLVLPLSDCVKALLDFVLSYCTRPRRLPRLELGEGIGPEGKTLCVISLLLTGEEDAKKAVAHMKEYRYANRDCGRELLFGLLCDLPDSDRAENPGEAELLDRTRQLVEELNLSMGGGFFLFTRPRSFDPLNGSYRGFERKRGALLALCKLLRGQESELQCTAGDDSRLADTAYILALDSDTRLTPGTARAMIGAMLHPLNHCILDRDRAIVTGGYGVLQPKLATELSSSTRTDFSRFFSAQGGMSSYRGCFGELYFDRFDSGGFSGKGLIDIDALLCVSERHIPAGQVLSHDALEGAFLRGGLLEDVELTDRFPASPLSYGRRQKRWVRGDWQNSPWLFARGKLLRPIERWRLFDSLRRSLVDFASLLGLVAALFFPDALGFAGIILSVSLFFRLFLDLLSTLLQREENVYFRLLSRILHGTAGAFSRTLLCLLLLPWTAGLGFGSAFRGLWRLCATKRKLLEWETAAESDRGKNTLRAYVRAMGLPMLTGLLCLFSPLIIGKSAGLLWLFSPLCLRALGQEKKAAKSLSEEERKYLMDRAAELWRWFSRFCDSENHYLPPDNLQELPSVGLAHRTSPTNIGLMLTSALCALDLELCTRDDFVTLLSHTLDTLERLDKWRGHLYNWYDTRSLRVLHPAYVSTVDSGNLAAALTALLTGLEEYGLGEQALRVRRLRDTMDFAALYDGERELFRIGLDPAKPEKSENYYDLLESEQRLCAYYAIASGQVSVRHWNALSRAQLEFDGYRGCASWSGSMFEYLMPELFLPLTDCSLLSESARFCVYVQSRHRFGREKVWGKSESAFFSLDASLNYRYKAHGVQALSLCRGINEEKVVAPYASFLALCVSRDKAIENLRRLERMGALGPWGFWDAVDFTPERCGREPKAVRCVMAHHMGMSMAAITNCLKDNILQKRFMAQGSMSAYSTLLEERVPLGGPLLRRRSILLPERSGFSRDSVCVRKGRSCQTAGGAIQPLSNGSYNLLLSESAVSRAVCRGLLVYAADETLRTERRGVECFLELDDERFSLLPGGESVGRFRWEFSGDEAVWQGERGSLKWELRVSVSESENAEKRSLTLRGIPERCSAAVYWGFEPVLARPEDVVAARSYARLGLRVRRSEDGCLVSRLPRGEQKAAYLSCTLNGKAPCSGDFFRFPGRDGAKAFRENEGWQSAPFCTLRQELQVKNGAARSELVLAVGEDAAETVAAAKRTLNGQRRAAMAEAAARLLGMDGTDVADALRLLPYLVYPHAAEEQDTGADARQSALWPWGISGDVPIVALELTEESLRAAACAVKHHALLSCCGVVYDLVFLSDTGGEYRPGPRLALEELLRRLGQEGRIGKKGGCHFADLAALGVVRANAALLPDESGRIKPETVTVRDEKETVREVLTPTASGSFAPYRESWGEDYAYVLRLRGLLPERARCQMLANENFGALFSECGCVGLWYKNARECPILRPCRDPLSIHAPETLEMRVGGQWLSLFAQRGEECLVSYGFGYARWEKTVDGVAVKLTATVPTGSNERIYTIETSQSAEMRWRMPLQLSAEARDASFCVLSQNENGDLTVKSKRCAFPGVKLTVKLSVPWLGHNIPKDSHRMAEPVIEGSFMAEGHVLLRVGIGEPAEEAESCADTINAWKEKLSAIRVKTASEELNRLMNGWSLYQTLCGRLRGRCSIYQSGGAVGFRDQLQDAVNLIDFDPALARRQILLCANHMYEEGDVQHWWHPGPTLSDRGCRSRCSDDLLWLVWALNEYCAKSGDRALCFEKAAYLHSLPLTKDERSRYELPELSSRRETVLEHCRRALELSLRRGKGQHGLLLMLGGDWNDGLDDMGEGAESVWLSFFWCLCARGFADLLDALGESDGEYYRRCARELCRACEDCWNGSYWPRAYYGDGRQLGTVDAICQAFGALCPGTDPGHGETALSTAMEVLYDREHKLLKLSAEPYSGERSPGYISSYGPGFRENGGQYTHGALFLSHALFRRGRSGDGWTLLQCAMGADRGEEFGLEPYLIPADVSANADCPGRGGWSWYTGSAGWFYRVALEDLLCCERRDGELSCEPPHLPEGMQEARVEF